MATTVPYSQPAGNNGPAMGNAQGPAYNMLPSGTQVKCKLVYNAYRYDLFEQGADADISDINVSILTTQNFRKHIWQER